MTAKVIQMHPGKNCAGPADANTEESRSYVLLHRRDPISYSGTNVSRPNGVALHVDKAGPAL